MLRELGVGDQGRETSPVAIYETTAAPPIPRPTGAAAHLDLGIEPGFSRFLIVDWPAGVDAQMHHTDTIDYDVTLRGSVDIVLDDGRHHLEAGDSVVVPGVDHGWLAGPDGCVMAVCLLGSST